MEAARSAVPDDLERLVALARACREELEPSKGGVLWALRDFRPEPVEAGLAAAVADPAVLVVVGTFAAVALGYAVVERQPVRDGSVLAVLTDLYVEPAARGVGIGEAMMDAVVDWARTGGCRGIDSAALPGNRETKNFFERFGLVARAIVVHRPLEVDR